MMMILVVLSSDYNFRLNWSYRVTELQAAERSRSAEFQSYKVTAQIRNPTFKIQNPTSEILNP